MCVPVAEQEDDAWLCVDGYIEEDGACIVDGCGADACPYLDVCVRKPQQAVCITGDDHHAWKCAAGYVEEGRECVKR